MHSSLNQPPGSGYHTTALAFAYFLNRDSDYARELLQAVRDFQAAWPDMKQGLWMTWKSFETHGRQCT
jgi:hypothetical protein